MEPTPQAQGPQNSPRSIPVWRFKDNAWLLGLSTVGTVPGFITWSDDGILSIIKEDGTSVLTTKASEVTSSMTWGATRYGLTPRYTSLKYVATITAKTLAQRLLRWPRHMSLKMQVQLF